MSFKDYDVYYLSGYVKAFQVHGDGEPLLFYYHDVSLQVIAITNNGDSPVAKEADYVLITATREKLLLEDFCFSRVPATVVAESLYLLLESGRPGAKETIRRHELSIADDKNVSDIPERIKENEP